MTASSKPKTPSMKLPIFDHVPEPELAMFIKDAKKVVLSELVEKVTVTENLSIKTVENGHSRLRTYTVLLDFYPAEEYLEEHNLTPQQILESLPQSFGLHVRNEVLRELKEVGKMMKNDLEGIGKGKAIRIAKGSVNEHLAEDIEDAGDAAAGDDAESDAGDGDAGDEKRAAKQKEVATYDNESDAGSDRDLDDIEGDFPADVDADEAATLAAQAAELAERNEEISATFCMAAKYVSKFTFDTKAGASCQFDLQVRHLLLHPVLILSTIRVPKTDTIPFLHFDPQFPGDSQKLLVVDVIERCCQKAVVHQIPLISRAIRLRTMNGDDEAWPKEGGEPIGSERKVVSSGKVRLHLSSPF
jgi:DNA-directed RNA polymerase I subunit RPA1